MTPAEFARAFDVSRETCGRLEAYVALLVRWNARINLVSPSTLETVWIRHIADSVQLFDLARPNARRWIDLGSGAGLPGLPIAAIAAERAPNLRVTLVEGDVRKAAFLATASREMGLDVNVESRRIESMAPQAYDVISARALAPLAQLCALAHRFSGPGTIYLFLKGEKLDSELTATVAGWHIQAERIVSRTDPKATVLRILELDPRS